VNILMKNWNTKLKNQYNELHLASLVK